MTRRFFDIEVETWPRPPRLLPRQMKAMEWYDLLKPLVDDKRVLEFGWHQALSDTGCGVSVGFRAGSAWVKVDTPDLIVSEAQAARLVEARAKRGVLELARMANSAAYDLQGGAEWKGTVGYLNQQDSLYRQEKALRAEFPDLDDDQPMEEEDFYHFFGIGSYGPVGTHRQLGRLAADHELAQLAAIVPQLIRDECEMVLVETFGDGVFVSFSRRADGTPLFSVKACDHN